MKKIVSLLVICMLIVSSVGVQAATGTVTLDLGDAQEITDRTSTIKIPINLSTDFEMVEPEYDDEDELMNTPVGIAVAQWYIDYDSTVLTFAGYEKGTMRSPSKSASKMLTSMETTPVGAEATVSETTKRVSGVYSQIKVDVDASYYKAGVLVYATFTVAEGISPSDVTTNVKFASEIGATCKTQDLELNNYNTVVDGGDVDIVIKGQNVTKYAVSASANNADYGTVALDSNEVEEGGKVTVTATPEEGYEVESYSVNGGEAVAVNTNTFEVANITADTTIVVNFKKVVRVTAIKTFDNRLYDNGTLYTGVTISEGDDYAAAATIKAGINIAKAGTENGVNYWLMDGKAPVSTGNNTSVYVIGLNNVTDTTDITKASASKGILVVGGTTYYGDPVTAIYGE